MMLPNASSPIHHHSSDDFEFTVTLSPRKSTTTNLRRPADELFCNGQLLPLHLSPSNSMVRTLLLISTTTTARYSSDYHSSSRPSSAQDDNHLRHKLFPFNSKTQKVVSGKKFSSVFRKETSPATSEADPANISGSSVKRAKEKIRKYLKKAKPLYEKLSQLQKTPQASMAEEVSPSFSGNLMFLRRTSCASSCPSTMPLSPTHSGVLCRKTMFRGTTNNSSSTDELQSAIQGAIAHCKNSMTDQTGSKHK